MFANIVSDGGRHETVDGGIGCDCVSDLGRRDRAIEFGVVVLQKAAIGLRVEADRIDIQRDA